MRKSFTDGFGVEAIVESDGMKDSEDSNVTNRQVVSCDEVLASVVRESLLDVVKHLSRVLNSHLDLLLGGLGSEEGHVKVALPEVVDGVDSPVSPVHLSGGGSVKASLDTEEMQDSVALVEDLAFVGLPDWNLAGGEESFSLKLLLLFLGESDVLVLDLCVPEGHADWFGSTVDIEVVELWHLCKS